MKSGFSICWMPKASYFSLKSWFCFSYFLKTSQISAFLQHTRQEFSMACCRPPSMLAGLGNPCQSCSALVKIYHCNYTGTIQKSCFLWHQKNRRLLSSPEILTLLHWWALCQKSPAILLLFRVLLTAPFVSSVTFCLFWYQDQRVSLGELSSLCPCQAASTASSCFAMWRGLSIASIELKRVDLASSLA